MNLSGAQRRDCERPGVGEPEAERIRVELSRPMGGAAPHRNVIRAPYGAAQHAPIDERDIAAVAVEALLTDRLLATKGAADRAPVPVGPRARRHAGPSSPAADQIRRDSTRGSPPSDAGSRFPRRFRHRVHAAAGRGGGPARSHQPHDRGDPGPSSDQFCYLGR